MDKELAISLIEALKNGLHETGKDFPYRDEVIPPSKEALDIGIKYLKEAILPDEIKQKTGHWIDLDEKSAVCSCCYRNNLLYGDFCKWCGAKMKSEE